jgi:hypothetical protein
MFKARLDSTLQVYCLSSLIGKDSGPDNIMR